MKLYGLKAIQQKQTSIKYFHILIHLGFRSQLEKFFFKTRQKENIFGFAGHMIFVTTTQICCYNMKTVTDNTLKSNMAVFQ